MLRNSRLSIRMVMMLLFAIIGHEVLMVGVHAGSHVEQYQKHSVHDVHEPVGKPSKSSMHVDGHSDSGDCAPGHEFVRRVVETTVVSDQGGAVSAPVLMAVHATRLRLANGEAPGRPPDQRRALLQVFLN